MRPRARMRSSKSEWGALAAPDGDFLQMGGCWGRHVSTNPTCTNATLFKSLNMLPLWRARAALLPHSRAVAVCLFVFFCLFSLLDTASATNITPRSMLFWAFVAILLLFQKRAPRVCGGGGERRRRRRAENAARTTTATQLSARAFTPERAASDRGQKGTGAA